MPVIPGGEGSKGWASEGGGGGAGKSSSSSDLESEKEEKVGSEPVWPGYYDGENWCDADGSTLEGKNKPTHWAHFPEPPEKEGQ